MSRRHLVNAFLLALFCVGLAVRPLLSQTSSADSLGDLARRLREERAREARKPLKVYTNDNLPARPKEEAPTMSTGMAVLPVAQPEKKTETASSESAPAHDEKYFRSRMAELQHRLDIDKRELEVMQQKLGLNQTQFYADPNKTLQQEYSRTDLNKLNDQITKKKDQIAQDEKDIDDLRDQLRREGGNPGWLR